MAEHAAPNHGRRRGAKIDAEKKIAELFHVNDAPKKKATGSGKKKKSRSPSPSPSRSRSPSPAKKATKAKKDE